jgi:RNA polymerase sigma factor (sigma-70 family)
MLATLYPMPTRANVSGMADSSPSDVATKLLAHRHVFKSFVASRVGNEADAEDLLQSGLVKALDRAGEVKDGEKAVAWFYQLLRNVIIDHVRSRTAAAKREETWAVDTATLREDEEAERQICACFERMLPVLKPMHAELLRRVELQDQPVAQAAAALGITPNNASVTLHRARGELRTKLVDFCGDCQCLDNCECE